MGGSERNSDDGGKGRGGQGEKGECSGPVI